MVSDIALLLWLRCYWNWFVRIWYDHLSLLLSSCRILLMTRVSQLDSVASSTCGIRISSTTCFADLLFASDSWCEVGQSEFAWCISTWVRNLVVSLVQNWILCMTLSFGTVEHHLITRRNQKLALNWMLSLSFGLRARLLRWALDHAWALLS